MRPVFADPKTDFVFKRIFGSEVHKPLLIELLDLYDRAKIAEQDARGALTLAERQGREVGREEGREEELRESIHTFCQAFEIELGADRESILAGMGTAELKALQVRLFRERRWS